MATHKSAEKRNKQNVKKKLSNRQARSNLRSAVKEVDLAISKKDNSLTSEALKKATCSLAKAATKKLVHKKTAARKISRLAKRVNSLKK